jgi:FkbM family methyltransferase
MDVRQIAADGMIQYRRYLVDHTDPHVTHPYLIPTSLVIDVGGYCGDWTATILRKYSPFVTVFEPVKENVEILKLRFQNDFRVNICPVALDDHPGQGTIFVYEDRSNFFVEGAPQFKTESVLIQDIGTYPTGGADLISLNCEGSEYRIIPRIIQTKQAGLFKNIQVQFHYENIQNALEMREKIRTELSKTHKEEYCFPFVWESWKRKY